MATTCCQTLRLKTLKDLSIEQIKSRVIYLKQAKHMSNIWQAVVICQFWHLIVKMATGGQLWVDRHETETLKQFLPTLYLCTSILTGVYLQHSVQEALNRLTSGKRNPQHQTVQNHSRFRAKKKKWGLFNYDQVFRIRDKCPVMKAKITACQLANQRWQTGQLNTIPS